MNKEKKILLQLTKSLVDGIFYVQIDKMASYFFLDEMDKWVSNYKKGRGFYNRIQVMVFHISLKELFGSFGKGKGTKEQIVWQHQK